MRFIAKFLSVAALVCVVTSPAWAQCTPYTHYEEGYFFFGWQVGEESSTLDGQPLDLGLVILPGDAPVEHGWSSHGYEVYSATLEGDVASTFLQTMPYIATVDHRLTGLKGNRREIEPGKVFRHYFNYKGEGTIGDGTGYFEGATGHVVTRGPFWLDLVVLVPGQPAIPAQIAAALGLIPPGEYGGWYKFETKGQICGLD